MSDFKIGDKVIIADPAYCYAVGAGTPEEWVDPTAYGKVGTITELLRDKNYRVEFPLDNGLTRTQFIAPEFLTLIEDPATRCATADDFHLMGKLLYQEEGLQNKIREDERTLAGHQESLKSVQIQIDEMRKKVTF